MSGYEYDVFLSYRRGQQLADGGDVQLERVGEWVQNVFYPEFREWLLEALPHATIAFDKTLPIGRDWEEGNRERLRRSRCLVAVLNPSYFRSAPCRSEFHSMLARQKRTGEPNGETPGLVLPVRYSLSDEWFDREATRLQNSLDFSKFSVFRKPIENQDRQAEFSTTMRQFCRTVARAAQSAPRFSASFPWKEMQPRASTGYPVPRLQ